MDSFGLFHQHFEPLKIHQTISNSNQTIHKTLYLTKMDKLAPKNNQFRKPYLKKWEWAFKNDLYDHKAIKMAARYHKF